MRLDTPPLVLHVIHHLRMGGMENGLINLINRMPAEKFRHAIACVEGTSSFQQRIDKAGVEVFALHRSQIGVWGLRRALYRLCRELRPAIVHSRNMSGLDALLPARLAAVPHRIHGEHGRDVDDLNGENKKNILLRRLHRPLVNRYITVSKDLERYLIGRVGVPAQRIEQIYNGVDTVRFGPVAQKSVALLPPQFSGADKIVIGAVGRLQPVKDQATLLHAFAQLRERQPQLDCYLALFGDGPLRESLQRLAAVLQIDERVHFAGAVDTVPEALRSLDLFVLPSLGEGISNTILEALASGLPVIATAVGGNVELIDAGETGALFEPRDVNALTGLLARYANDKALRRRQSVQARNTATSRFSLDAMVANYQRVYESLIASNT
jgi:sugar transferase (PEP-CTERM/EpsH1 system associated)